MAKPSGEIIERPITSNFREGLTVLEYFISALNSRKTWIDALSDIVLSAHLFRKLVDVAQDVIITEEDCGTVKGIVVQPINEGDEEVVDLKTRIIGRTSCETIKAPVSGQVVVEAGQTVDEAIASTLDHLGVEQLSVRSILTCETKRGVCSTCYGRNLANGKQVQIGEAVGIIAAQSIGEPGTQQTMRTFHIGGTASQACKQPIIKSKNDDMVRKSDTFDQHVRTEDSDLLAAKTLRKVAKTKDITDGLPRVAELFEARKTKDSAEIAKIDGIVKIEGATRGKRRLLVLDVETKQEVEHLIPLNKHIIVADGERVKKGNPLTEGPVPLHEILQVRGPAALQEHLLNEVQEVFRLHDVEINDKHIEIIIRQMLCKVKITDPGDTTLLWDDKVNRTEFEVENDRITKLGGKPAEGDHVLLGITEAALCTESFISAASIKHAIRVLTEAAALGKIDNLHGLRERIIVGQLIPVGTGFCAYRNLETAQK